MQQSQTGRPGRYRLYFCTQKYVFQVNDSSESSNITEQGDSYIIVILTNIIMFDFLNNVYI